MNRKDDPGEFSLFAGLSTVELDPLRAVLLEATYSAQEMIYREGDPGDSLLLLRSGTILVSIRGADGKEIELARRGPGSVVGELSAFTHRPRTATVIAETECQAYILPNPDFIRVLQNNSRLSMWMLRELALQIECTNAKLSDFAYLDVYRRVANVLNAIARCSDSGRLKKESLPTPDEISSMVGTNRDLTEKALRQLENDGFIQVDDQSVTLVAMPG